MKKIIGIIVICLIMNFGYSGIGMKKPSEIVEELNQNNTVSLQENIANKENESEGNYETEQNKKEEIIVSKEVEIDTTPNVVNTAKPVEKKSEVTTKKQENIKSSNTQEKVVEQSQSNIKQIEQPKQNNSQVQTPVATETKKELTPSDLEYWCVSGGKHHVAGDGANEHGYYNSWEEANNAFEIYTKGWASVQYKISRCSCGLYYFWAIQ